MPVGSSCIGAVGRPSEEVAKEAATSLLQHHASGAALDRHLADQLLLRPGGPSVSRRRQLRNAGDNSVDASFMA